MARGSEVGWHRLCQCAFPTKVVPLPDSTRCLGVIGLGTHYPVVSWSSDY